MGWHTCAYIPIVALAIVPAWFFGGSQTEFQVWLYVAALVCVAAWVMIETQSRERVAIPTVMVPLVLGVLWGSLQLIPLPGPVRNTIAPAGEQWRQDATGDSYSVTPDVSQHSSLAALSLYPASTRRDLALLILAASVFFLSAGLIRTRTAFTWLCAVVACNGAALAIFGFVQKLSWNGQLFWTVPLTKGGAPFASFVNRNNAAGYLNLCLAAAIGYGTFALARHFSRHRENFDDSDNLPWTQKAQERWDRLLRAITPTHLFAGAIASLLVAGVLASLSRGGVLSLAVAASIVSVVGCLLWRVRLAWPSVVILAGVLTVGWIGVGDALKDRMATLFQKEVLTNARLDHWKDSAAVIADFWTSGSGLGTYRYIYRPYQDEPSNAWFYHAENQFIEAFVEAGLLGVLLMTGCIALSILAAWALIREPGQWRSFAVGAAALYALISQAVHANFDFGLYLPANFLLLAILLGAACGLAARRFPMRPLLCVQLARIPAVVTGVIGVTMTLGLIWGGHQTFAASQVDLALREARWDDLEHEIPICKLTTSIARLESALAQRSDDADGQLRIAEMRIQLYRRQMMERLADGEDTAAMNESERLALWNWTSPLLMYAQSQQDAATGSDSPELTQWRESLLVQRHLTPARHNLVRARDACPLLADVEIRLAELSGALKDISCGEEHVARAARLAPTDTEIRFYCGVLHFEAGRIKEAAVHWRDCLELDKNLLKKVLAVTQNRITIDEFATEVLPSRPLLVLELAQQNSGKVEHQYRRTVLVRRAEELLSQSAVPQDEEAYARGLIAHLRNDLALATKHFRRAVEKRPDNLAWRLRLAEVLLEQGRIGEAHEEARKCIRMNPMHKPSLTLLKTIYQQRSEVLHGRVADPTAERALATGNAG